MNFKVDDMSQNTPQPVGLRCPACRQRGVFEQIGTPDVAIGAGAVAGIRRCPDPACHSLVFFVSQQGSVDGLDDLRLLGNDAAHIESQEYTKVGKEEVEVGIEFGKEVLKAVYQYAALLDKLRALKKPAQP
jgi:hypothetical protein